MNSADTADQMMKMTLEGIQVAAEVGLKAGGMAARSLAVTLYAILKDNKKEIIVYIIVRKYNSSLPKYLCTT